MKNVILAVGLLFIFHPGAMGQEVRRNFLLEVYSGYSAGVSGAFGDERIVDNSQNNTFTSSSEAGFNLGVRALYEVSSKTSLGLEVLMQNFTYSWDNTPIIPGPNAWSYSGEDAGMRLDLLFAGRLRLGDLSAREWFLTFGGGYYDFSEKGAGVNVGLLYQKKVSEILSLTFHPRLHLVAAGGELGDNAYNFLQLSGGALFSL